MPWFYNFSPVEVRRFIDYFKSMQICLDWNSLLWMLHQLRIQLDNRYKANNHQHKENAKIQHTGLSWAKQNRIINKRKTKITKLVHSIQISTVKQKKGNSNKSKRKSVQILQQKQ
jgi:hypothetical protein